MLTLALALNTSTYIYPGTVLVYYLDYVFPILFLLVPEYTG